jgi:hypothetical protein
MIRRAYDATRDVGPVATSVVLVVRVERIHSHLRMDGHRTVSPHIVSYNLLAQLIPAAHTCRLRGLACDWSACMRQR